MPICKASGCFLNTGPGAAPTFPSSGDLLMKYLLCLSVLLSIAQPAAADAMSPEARADIELTRALINDRRNTALARNMTFTESERAAFWPLYEQYRNAMSNVNSRRLDLIVDYADHFEEMSEPMAADMLRRAMVYEEQALKVKQLYMDKFAEILPPSKVGRLYQIETRMDNAIELKLSEGIPLME
jgi:hypothetical protein